MPEQLALKLAERVTEPVEGGWRWRWDPSLRSPSSIVFSGTKARYIALLGQIQASVTLIFGEASHFKSMNYQSELRRALPEAQMMTLPGGHNLHIDAPQAISSIIAKTAGSPLRLMAGQES
jgi:pimeloyl-ACP methyl ester carboxylesterase